MIHCPGDHVPFIVHGVGIRRNFCNMSLFRYICIIISVSVTLCYVLDLEADVIGWVTDEAVGPLELLVVSMLT